MVLSEKERFARRQQRNLYIKSIIRKIFFEDWPMKVAALVITLALWFGVTGSSKPTSQRMNGIPLNLSFPSNIEATTSTSDIDVIISGDKRKIDQINRNDLVVRLDLSNVPAGDRVIQLSPDTVSLALPTGVRLDEVQPRQIAIKLEPLETKEVPVNIVTTGRPADGFEVYGETASPARVRVRGPANLMRSLSAVSTANIDLTGRNADFGVRQVEVNVSDAKAVLLDTLVDASIRIGEKRSERSYSVPLRDDPKRRMQVVLYGGTSVLDSIKADDIHVTMDPDANGVPKPQITLPPAVRDRVEIRPRKER